MKLYYQTELGWVSATKLEAELSRKNYIEHALIDDVYVITFDTSDDWDNDYDDIHPKLGIKYKKEYFHIDWKKLVDGIIEHNMKTISSINIDIDRLRSYDGQKYNYEK